MSLKLGLELGIISQSSTAKQDVVKYGEKHGLTQSMAKSLPQKDRIWNFGVFTFENDMEPEYEATLYNVDGITLQNQFLRID